MKSMKSKTELAKYTNFKKQCKEQRKALGLKPLNKKEIKQVQDEIDYLASEEAITLNERSTEWLKNLLVDIEDTREAIKQNETKQNYDNNGAAIANEFLDGLEKSVNEILVERIMKNEN